MQARNRKKYKCNKTGYTGVSPHYVKKDGTQTFVSYITVDKKRISLGLYENIVDAVKARNAFIVSNDLKGFKLQTIKRNTENE